MAWVGPYRSWARSTVGGGEKEIRGRGVAWGELSEPVSIGSLPARDVDSVARGGKLVKGRNSLASCNLRMSDCRVSIALGDSRQRADSYTRKLLQPFRCTTVLRFPPF